MKHIVAWARPGTGPTRAGAAPPSLCTQCLPPQQPRPGPGPAHAKDMFHICIYILSYIILDPPILSYIIPCFPWGVTPYFFPRATP